MFTIHRLVMALSLAVVAGCPAPSVTDSATDATSAASATDVATETSSTEGETATERTESTTEASTATGGGTETDVDGATSIESPGAACVAFAGSLLDCKNCCDCVETGVCDDQRVCRDECNRLGDAHFKANADARPYSIETPQGNDGDYSACTSLATDAECKDCCDCGTAFACGDHRFCRDACAAKFGTAPPKP